MDSGTLGAGVADADLTLAIGCFASIGRCQLADLLVGFSRAAPGVDVGVHEMPRAALLPALIAGELDLVVMPARPLTDLPNRQLWQDRAMVAMAHDHPLAERAILTVTDLIGQTFLISRQAQPGEMHRFLAERIGAPATLTGVLCSTGLPRLLDRVAAGRELALVPDTWPIDSDLVTCPFDAERASFAVHAYWRDRQPEASLVQLISTSFTGA